MKIPRSYRQVTVKQYIAIQNISPNLSKRERAALRLSILSNKPLDFFEQMDFGTFDQLYSKTLFLDKPLPGRVRKTIWIKGTRYKLLDKVRDHNTETWLSNIHYRTIGTLNNIDNILAWIYRPTLAKHNPEKAAEDFANASMADVYGAFFLFCHRTRKWKVALQYSNQQLMELLEEHLTEAVSHPWQNIGGGITPLKG